MNEPNPPSDAIRKNAEAEQAPAQDATAQPADETKQSKEESISGTEGVFKVLESQQGPGSLKDINLILDVPVKLSVELGRTKMSIRELLSLSQGSAVALDELAGGPLDILINNFLIAKGEVVVIAEKYGVRITEIITPSERMRRLSR